ncbi:MAG TPA: response regulator transcription factor [Acetobacteraceae bacterium]|nr:response regulator transcription factor [Acetobacteraceae bacterium]
MRVLLIEDNARLAELLAIGLGRAGWAADIVESLDEAEAACRATSFDAVLLDRGLPDGDGLDLLRRFRANEKAPPVLVMSARGSLADRCEGLNRGADDYLVKPVAMEELVARLNAAVRRARAGSRTGVLVGRLDYDPGSRAILVGDLPFDPPPRERTLLEHLLQAAPRPVTKEALEERLNSLERGIGSNAVEVYIHRLRRRLEQAEAGVAIETVRGVGYRLRAAEG